MQAYNKHTLTDAHTSQTLPYDVDYKFTSELVRTHTQAKYEGELPGGLKFQ